MDEENKDINTFNDPMVEHMDSAIVKTAGNSDATIVGIPYDGGIISHRRGARFAPNYVRNMLSTYSTFCTDHRADLSKLKIRDAGNLDTTPIDKETMEKAIFSSYPSIINSTRKLITIGGDHSITAPIIRTISKVHKGKRIGVILFDAHHDIRDPWRTNSGSWGHEILNEFGGPIYGSNFIQIGVRGFKYSSYYNDKMARLGIRYFTSLDVFSQGIMKVLKDAINLISDNVDIIYASLDIDVLDQTQGPAVSAASPGGLTSRELFYSMYELGKNEKVRYIDITEYAPPLDINDITGRIVSESMLHFLCGAAPEHQ